jgi:hypothetical protein
VQDGGVFFARLMGGDLNYPSDASSIERSRVDARVFHLQPAVHTRALPNGSVVACMRCEVGVSVERTFPYTVADLQVRFRCAAGYRLISACIVASCT